MTRKLKEPIDISDFLRAAQTCRGEVFFEDALGDRLNLKSALTQYVFAIALYKMDETEHWLRFEEADKEILLPYLREECAE